jgi:anti-anti-sigma factor
MTRPVSGFPRPLAAVATPDFGAHVDLLAGRMTLTGRLDVRTAHLLYDAVSTVLTAGPSSWIVDVGGLTDIDHAGLRSLLRAYRRTLRHGRRIILYRPSPSLERAVTLLRLDHHVLQGARGPVPGIIEAR